MNDLINLYQKELKDSDITDEFLKNNFDNPRNELLIDISHNFLTELAAIHILEYLYYNLYTPIDNISFFIIDLSYNRIHIKNPKLIDLINNFLDRFEHSTINIRGNYDNTHLADFIHYENLSRIKY